MVGSFSWWVRSLLIALLVAILIVSLMGDRPIQSVICQRVAASLPPVLSVSPDPNNSPPSQPSAIIHKPIITTQAPTTGEAEAMPSNLEWKTISIFRGSQHMLGKKGELHSQVGQDWVVGTLSGCKRNGWFVDLAANDAQYLSNSLMLERDFDWKGICIEANMNYMHKLARRQCKVVSAAVGAQRNEEVKFVMRGVMGGIVGNAFDNKRLKGNEVDLRIIPLGEILAEMGAPAVIDYLSLDVEGAESVVMQDFPWHKYRFLIITIERPKADLVKMLEDHDYRRLRVNKYFGDETWLSTTIPNFTALMENWVNKKQGEKGTALTSCMVAKGYGVPAAFRTK